MPLIRLSELEVGELRNLMQTTPNAHLYRKAQVIWLTHLGKGISEIAKITNMNERTIYRWLAFYKEKKFDALLTGSRRGRPPKITEEYRKLLLESVQKSPKAFGCPTNKWTLKLLAQHMTLNTGIEVSFSEYGKSCFPIILYFVCPRSI